SGSTSRRTRPLRSRRGTRGGVPAGLSIARVASSLITSLRSSALNSVISTSKSVTPSPGSGRIATSSSPRTFLVSASSAFQDSYSSGARKSWPGGIDVDMILSLLSFGTKINSTHRRGQVMITLVIEHGLAEWGAWKRVFDEHATSRKEHGCIREE